MITQLLLIILVESPNPETHLERGRVEDIPDYNPEIAQALLGSEAKSTDSVRSDNAAAVEDRLSIHEVHHVSITLPTYTTCV